MRVLIVEDEPDQLMIRGMLLRESGFEVAEAATGAAALEEAATGQIDCAVIDLRLPTEQEGMALIGKLKEQWPELVVMVLTGGSAESVAGRTEMSGVEAVFEKGRSIAPLVERLRGLCRAGE